MAEISCEVGAATEQIERFSKNGQSLAERAAETGERDLANSTVANVGHQVQHLRHLLEQKKMAVGEAMDSWQKFLDMHGAVTQWAADKSAFLAESLAFATLGETKQKLQVYAVAMKSIRYSGSSEYSKVYSNNRLIELDVMTSPR